MGIRHMGLVAMLVSAVGCSGGASMGPGEASATAGTAAGGMAGTLGTAGSGTAGTSAAGTVAPTPTAGTMATPMVGADAGTGTTMGPAFCNGDPVCERTYRHVDHELTSGQQLVGSCPDGFTPMGSTGAGTMNTDFPQDRPRRFIVRLPEDMSTPRPVMLCYTGTVESETAFCDSHWSQPTLGKLNESHGFIVLIPYRDSSEAGGPFDGRIWWPWYDGVSPPSDEEGPDVKFMIEMTKCVATKYPIDEGKIYVGGISAGGSMTLRTLAFASDFFAGGINSSGTWYEGGAGPATPLPADDMIVITTWGGVDDQWPATNPLTVYAKETKQASEYFGAMPDVKHIACSHSLGHRWPGINDGRAQMNDWMVQTLLSYPKRGSAPFTLTQPPPGPDTAMTCVEGVYTDH